MKYYTYGEKIFLSREAAEDAKRESEELCQSIFEGAEDMLPDFPEDEEDDIIEEKELPYDEEIYEIPHEIEFASGRKKSVIEYRVRKKDAMKIFGLFNNAAFPGVTLVVLNGEARLVDTEQVVKASNIHTPADVWKALVSAPYKSCAESVLKSDGWISRGNNRIDYKISYGLPDDYEIVANLKYYKAAAVPVKSICKSAGMSQAAVAERFGIPRRTMEDWCRGVSKCPIYTRLMMQECLGLIKR